VRDLFNDFCSCFADADVVIVSEIYKAGEDPITGINMESLVKGIKDAGKKAVYPLNNATDLAGLINEVAKAGDIVVCLGAGDITKWAGSLPEELAALGDRKIAAS